MSVLQRPADAFMGPGEDGGASPPTSGGGQTQAWALNAGTNSIEFGGSYGGNNPTRTFSGSFTWVAAAIVITGA